MRIGIKAKQIAAITSIVGLTVIALSLVQIASLTRIEVQSIRDRAVMLRESILNRAQQAVAEAAVTEAKPDPWTTLQEDPGLRSILQSGAYSQGVVWAAIVDRDQYVITHSDRAMLNRRIDDEPPPGGTPQSGENPSGNQANPAGSLPSAGPAGSQLPANPSAGQVPATLGPPKDVEGTTAAPAASNSAMASSNNPAAAELGAGNTAASPAMPRVHHQASGKKEPPLPEDLDTLLLQNNGLEMYRRLLNPEGQMFEVSKELLWGGKPFGNIRIRVSTLLVVKEVNKSIRPNLTAALIALAVGMFLALGLAQLFLRPIHVIRGALGRLGKGELGVTVDMPHKDEFGELGSFFNALSAQLSADRSTLAGEKAKLESVVDNLEDAVAIFNPEGELLFANPAMRSALPADAFARPIDDVLPAGHPYREAVEQTLATRQTHGPISAFMPDDSQDAPAGSGERLVMTHVISDVGDKIVGVMLVARNLDYLSRVQSTINYSRKLVALGRLSAGVAHEVKNPLNAMTIHLELLKQKLAAAKATVNERGEVVPLASGTPLAATRVRDGVIAQPSLDAESALEHVKIIANEIRRLDEVVQGFLKFTRPEELKLQPIVVRDLVDDVARIVAAEASTGGVQVRVECPDSVPDISGDPGMLRQALLNLAINACQAMPNGGHLRITCAAARGRRVEIKVEDTGVGISSEDLERIFNLYFTTKAKGSGIGLSMVYRIVQLHDGEIEVESMPGVGTTFRLLLPQL